VKSQGAAYQIRHAGTDLVISGHPDLGEAATVARTAMAHVSVWERQPDGNYRELTAQEINAGLPLPCQPAQSCRREQQAPPPQQQQIRDQEGERLSELAAKTPEGHYHELSERYAGLAQEERQRDPGMADY
jgi:hypothetical protein